MLFASEREIWDVIKKWCYANCCICITPHENVYKFTRICL